MDDILIRLVGATLLLSLSALVVQVASWILRLWSPRVRRIAWFLVLIQGVVLFHLRVPLPWHGPPAEHEVASQAGGPGAVAAEGPRPASALSVFSDAADGRVSAAIPAITPIPAAKTLDWPGIARALWLSGMAVLVVFSGLCYMLFLRRLSHGLPVEQTWADQWRGLLRERGISRPIALVTTQSAGPALCWMPWGYRLCVPRRFWAELTPGQRLAVLRHELARPPAVAGRARGRTWSMTCSAGYARSGAWAIRKADSSSRDGWPAPPPARPRRLPWLHGPPCLMASLKTAWTWCGAATHC